MSWKIDKLFIVEFNFNFIKILAETGEYWRLLNDDKYIVFAETNDGLRSGEMEVSVKNDEFGRAAIVNFELQKVDDKEPEQDSSEDEKYMMVTY